MNVSISINSANLARRDILGLLGPKKRTELGEAMALGVRELTRSHLLKLSGERHATANRLGASPSGFLSQAVRAVEAATVDARPDATTITISQVGLSRAFHDVTITPKSAKALTIPIAAIAYNRRAGQFSDLFVFKSKGGNAFLAQRDPTTKEVKPLFILLRSVTQKQDRTLLPSNAEWEDAAARTGRLWLDTKTSSIGGTP